jgi:hypothetical protein
MSPKEQEVMRRARLKKVTVGIDWAKPEPKIPSPWGRSKLFIKRKWRTLFKRE